MSVVIKRVYCSAVACHGAVSQWRDEDEKSHPFRCTTLHAMSRGTFIQKVWRRGERRLAVD